MALMHSTMVPLGTEAHDFNLPDPDGKCYTLADFKDAQVLVVIFMCNHCPYVKAVLDRLIDLANHFNDSGRDISEVSSNQENDSSSVEHCPPRGVQFVGINPNDADKYPDDSPESMKQLAEEKGMPFPYLIDADQEVARLYSAVCTPDFFVYGPDRKLAYRGRLDDNWQEAEKVTREELKTALDDLVANRTVPEKQTPSLGCSIKWK